MKRYSSVFSVVAIFVMVISLFGIAPVQAEGKQRVMVQFAPGQKAAVENALAAVGAEFHYSFDELDAFAVSLPEAALPGLSHNPNVVLIEEDPLRAPISIEPSSVQATDASTQVVPYGIDMVQARDVWDANRDGTVDAGAFTASNRMICIIDSGRYKDHVDFQGYQGTVAGYSSNWSSDGLGHGTHVAGTISAVNNGLGVVGVTPGTVNLYIVRVFGDSGEWIYASTLIDAAYKCRDAGANIISMSLGGSQSNLTEKNGFAALYNTNGILSIAAAGNAGTSAYSYPASYDTVVSVAAIDSNKTRASFSQYNSQVELAAPGVGVLSTVPYLEANSVTVDGVTYAANHIEFSGRGTASGALVNGGLCGTTGAWSGMVVLCERGTQDFYTKVMNVQNSGGVAAVIYNNVAGNFLGTLGDGNSSSIIAVSLSQADGQYLVANKLGVIASVASSYTAPASGYEYYDGTSMATPHVSAAAALVWSSKPTATNVQVRSALQATAQDLGTAGRDVYYGYGLVQAKAALDYLAGSSSGGTLHVADLDKSTTTSKSGWKATVTITVKDANGALVSGAAVAGKFNTTSVTCTTGAAGTCSVTASLKKTVTSVTYTVTGITLTGYTYDSGANTDPDGDSNGTSITITKP